MNSAFLFIEPSTIFLFNPAGRGNDYSLIMLDGKWRAYTPLWLERLLAGKEKCIVEENMEVSLRPPLEYCTNPALQFKDSYSAQKGGKEG